MVCVVSFSTVVDLSCGNGFLDAGEECDDNNVEIFDGCSRCQLDPFFMCQGAWRSLQFPNALGLMVTRIFCSFTVFLN